MQTVNVSIEALQEIYNIITEVKLLLIYDRVEEAQLKLNQLTSTFHWKLPTEVSDPVIAWDKAYKATGIPR